MYYTTKIGIWLSGVFFSVLLLPYRQLAYNGVLTDLVCRANPT